MSFQLREYQLEAVDKTMAGFEVYDRQCLVLGTGGGKTEIFIETARRYLEQNPGKAVLVLSHLSILTTQTLDRFHKRAPNIRTGVLQANVRPYVLSDVVVSTMQSSRDLEKTKFLKRRLAKEIGLIIIDEAHRAPNDSYQKILSYYPNAKLLGVTATPFRSNKIMTNFFQNVPYSLSIGALMRMGYLVPAKLWTIQRDSNETRDVIGQVVSLYCKHEPGKRSIVYMRTKDDCRTLREVFGLYGVTAEVIIDETDDRSRARIIRDFARGSTRVLISVDVLSEGFDCPPVQSIFMPYGVGSVTTFLQRVGRGLRTCDEIGKKFCRIYGFGTEPELADGFYSLASNLALNHANVVKEYPTILETFDLNNWDEIDERVEKKTWTLKVREAIVTLEKHGFSNLAGSLNRRELPESITLNVIDYVKNVRLIASKKSKTSLPSKRQLYKLESTLGFCPQDLSAAEASAVIDAIVGTRHGPDIMEEGRYKGHHISKLPHAYRSYIIKKYPESQTGQQLLAWRDRRTS